MKKSIRRILSGLLCAGVLALGIPAPARALTLTAVNDSILPLSDSTMPARLGGEIYVPYSVFFAARRVRLQLGRCARPVRKRRDAQLFPGGGLCL